MENGDREEMRGRVLMAAALVEGGFGLAAFFFAGLLDLSCFQPGDWNARALFIGILAIIPSLGFFLLLDRFGESFMKESRERLEEAVRPLFLSLNVSDLLVISLIAGFGEELFFRGFLQSFLARHTETPLAVLVTSLLFGALHYLTPFYALLTAVAGLYFGTLFVVTGNLWPAILAHFLHDFLALLIMRKEFLRKAG